MLTFDQPDLSERLHPMLKAETGIPFVAAKQPATPDLLASEIVNRLTYSTGQGSEVAQSCMTG